MHDILMSFGQLALACVLGGMIGYERQSRRKAAGLRSVWAPTCAVPTSNIATVTII